jgi:hypothetical protein
LAREYCWATPTQKTGSGPYGFAKGVPLSEREKGFRYQKEKGVPRTSAKSAKSAIHFSLWRPKRTLQFGFDDEKMIAEWADLADRRGIVLLRSDIQLKSQLGRRTTHL